MKSAAGLRVDLRTVRTHFPLEPGKPRDLEEAIAEREGVPREHIRVGRGALDLLKGLLVRLGGAVTLPAPEFHGYERTCPGARYSSRDGSFAPSLDGDVVLLSNPNNPTGTCHALGGSRARSIIVDEAYIEFAGRPSLAQEVPGRGDLVVLRTFSKCYGMMDEKVGYVVGPPDVVRDLGCAQPSATARDRASGLIGADLGALRTDVAARRAALVAILERFGCDVVPSVTNFVMARLPGGDLAGELACRGIDTLPLDGSPGLEDGYCRVAVPSYGELKTVEGLL